MSAGINDLKAEFEEWKAARAAEEGNDADDETHARPKKRQKKGDLRLWQMSLKEMTEEQKDTREDCRYVLRPNVTERDSSLVHHYRTSFSEMKMLTGFGSDELSIRACAGQGTAATPSASYPRSSSTNLTPPCTQSRESASPDAPSPNNSTPTPGVTPPGASPAIVAEPGESTSDVPTDTVPQLAAAMPSVSPQVEVENHGVPAEAHPLMKLRLDCKPSHPAHMLVIKRAALLVMEDCIVSALFA